MMKFFTSIVESCKDVAGKLRNLTAKANDIEFEDRQLMQQFGFISIPRKGDRVLLLQFGNVVIAVALIVPIGLPSTKAKQPFTGKRNITSSLKMMEP